VEHFKEILIAFNSTNSNCDEQKLNCQRKEISEK